MVSIAVWLLGTLLGYTWRVTIRGNVSMSPSSRQHTGRIFCFWHAHLLPIAFIFRNTQQTAVVSRSRDGQLAADVARMWRHDIIAGSSHRGGSSVIRQCVRLLDNKMDIGITPDGPKGPSQQVKPGAAQLAHVCSAPIVTLSVLPERAWYLNTWDHFMIPMPFTRITIQVGDPIDHTATGSSRDPVADLSRLLQEKLDASAIMA
jgi:lysophospholipid acyltransferase (LPLAT)-like uncharacterized protein